jgi:hypothetical protein
MKFPVQMGKSGRGNKEAIPDSMVVIAPPDLGLILL